jgi:gas vesicle protein
MIMKEELEKNNTVGPLLATFLAGGLIGAGIALLLAPKAGKDLRKDLRDIAAKTREDVTETVEKGRELYEESSSAVKGAIDAGKMAYIQERDKHRQAV